MNLAQQRIDELTAMHNRLTVIQPEDGTWDWFLKKEITDMQQNRNARRPGRTLTLRTRLKSLVLHILSTSMAESKGERV
ncbi:hypothetical protein G9G53_22400 [Paenibacillus sp. EKM206P]|uniref:hypothetical protein n=1 Tax=Paenibacillus sp. EKM206P TaxID=1683674 RepID=UPI0013EC44F1|nr:hypothetical protein [Paenibacillus sp. EKM206P]KAF6569046.1 hypothetical protein G9G53_22400 [Paenibacillus sp. EKM206P]